MKKAHNPCFGYHGVEPAVGTTLSVQDVVGSSTLSPIELVSTSTTSVSN